MTVVPLQRDDWRAQLRGAARNAAELAALGDFPQAWLRAVEEVAGRYPFLITPYYASLIDPSDAADPIARIAICDRQELADSPTLREDPLEEEAHAPVPRLIRRYPDRGLLLVTTHCATYCRFCTRKRLVGTGGPISKEELQGAVDYLAAHPEICDVLLSGGDPLLLGDDHLVEILAAVRTVPSVQIVRIATRMPVVLPMRITPELVDRLRAFAPLYLSTHFNHPRELTREAVQACNRLADAGIPLVNQSVLLAGVNDDVETLIALSRALLRARVRPTYLHQCDLTAGIEHLRTPLQRGIDLLDQINGRLSGIGIPTLIVDTPNGKIRVSPETIARRGRNMTLLQGRDGRDFRYPDPTRSAIPDPH